MAQNEEDVKNKIVVPYLKSLGFSIDEIQFEKKFSFILGTNTYQVGKNNSRKALGYSDILCKVGDKNIFMIEVKNTEVDITYNDIEQAISYASLVRPIAPFALITNGKDTKVYDVIDRKDITNSDIASSSSYWRKGLKLSVKEELEQRFLALNFFIGYSKGNLEAFSRSQVDSKISSLKGNVEDLTKKYIPELYLPPDDLIIDFDDFIRSIFQLYAIVGEAGVGKTNAICFLAERYLQDHLIFFFNGTELQRDVLTSIKDDCNWFFSPNLTIEEVLFKIISLTDDERKVIIFVDAIDEVMVPNFILELNELIKRIKKYQNIKLCVSCKTTEWSRFLNIKGNPTSLKDALFVSLEQSEDEKKSRVDIPGRMLRRFNNDQMNKLGKLYRSIYHYKGDLNDEVKNELRLGFSLKIFASVFEGKNIPKTLNNVDLFEEYLQKVLEKLDYEKGLNSLVEIARIILEEHDITSRYNLSAGLVEETTLRQKLRLTLNEKIYPELFSYNILVRVKGYDNINYIGFYYSKLRNFILSVKVLKIQTLNDHEFKQMLTQRIEDKVWQDVLLWYYTIASYSHRELFQKFYYGKALVFVQVYESMIDKHFYNIKDKFDPFTENSIGLIISKDIDRAIWSHAFYSIQNDSPKLLQLESEEFGFPSVFEKYGARTIRSGFENFLNSEPNKIASKIIYEQLKKIIENGELFEDNNYGLIVEKILSIVSTYSKELGIENKSRPSHTLDLEEFLPLDLSDILDKIKYKYAKIYYENQRIKELIDLGKIKVNYNGSFYSYSVNRSILDLNSINAKAKEAIQQNLYIPENTISGTARHFKILKESIGLLGQKKIEKSVLPPPDILGRNVQENLDRRKGKRNWIPDIVLAQYSDERLLKYAKTFFSVFLDEYKTIVESNFEGFENKFRLYKNLPVLIHCQIDYRQGWPLVYGFKRNDKNEVSIEINPEDTIWGKGREEYIFTYAATIESILWRTKQFPLGRNLNSDRAKGFCVVRNFLYDWLMQEVKDIFN